ncbi:MAG: protein jag [Desulfurivibrionaceae bacterium]
MTGKLKFKGKDVEEAIANASEKMKVPREQLDITIESPGSDGIFGLCRKSAVISASMKKKMAAEPEETPDQAWAGDENSEAESGPAEAEEGEAAPDRGDLVDDDREGAVAYTDKESKKVEIEEGPLPREIQEHLKSDLHKLLEFMAMPSEVECREEDNKTVLYISGDSESDLVADKGQLLDSLEYLLGRMAGRRYPQKLSFSLDAGNFRASRKTELEKLALKLSAEVKETGKTRTISPLNPSERRIVHMLLQQDNVIRSRSVGNGLFKKILIYLPGKARKQRKQKDEAKGQKTGDSENL